MVANRLKTFMVWFGNASCKSVNERLPKFLKSVTQTRQRSLLPLFECIWLFAPNNHDGYEWSQPNHVDPIEICGIELEGFLFVDKTPFFEIYIVSRSQRRKMAKFVWPKCQNDYMSVYSTGALWPDSKFPNEKEVHFLEHKRNIRAACQIGQRSSWSYHTQRNQSSSSSSSPNLGTYICDEQISILFESVREASLWQEWNVKYGTDIL